MTQEFFIIVWLNTSTKKYLDILNGWTFDVLKAHEFSTYERAQDFINTRCGRIGNIYSIEKIYKIKQ